MQIIVPATILVEQVVGKQKQTDGQTYRLMTYVIQCPVDDGVLLYHTLTCCLLLLSKVEAANITAQQELIDLWFLVPEEHDDHKLCNQIRQMAQLFKPSAKHVTEYTILPTTGCNARCFYCYEKGTKPITMSVETANKVSRYILEHCGEEKILLNWFGGEPLVNVKVIDQICTDLSKKNVLFRSKMTSNSYLFNKDMVQRAKELWQLNHIQITIDGTEQIYNRVKDYVYKGVNAFQRVLRNIELLTAENIKVVVRLNVDKHNIDEMMKLVAFLHQHFGTNKYLTIYSHELLGERSDEERADLYEQRMQLEKQIVACNYSTTKELQKDLKLIFCMADNDQSVIISPDGHLGKCEHYIDSEFYGHIDSENKDESILRKFKERPAETEACTICPCYPQCLVLKMCPNGCVCTPEKRQERIYNIKEAMKNEFQRYIEKNDKDLQVDDTEI